MKCARTCAVALLSLLASSLSVSHAQTVSYGPATQTQVDLGGPGSSINFAVGDFFGDGRQSYAVSRSIGPPFTPQALHIVHNTATTLVDETNTAFVGAAITSQAPATTLTADFNGDGRPDIFIADVGVDAPPHSGGQNKLALSRPDGRYEDKTNTNLPALLGFPHSATAADIDNDGDIDIYAGNLAWQSDPKAPHFLINDGRGVFTRTTANFTLNNSTSYTSSLLTDVNFDGAPDLVLGTWDAPPSTDPNNRLMLNNGDGTFGAVQALPPIPAGFDTFTKIASADLNRDGNPDLILSGTQQATYRTGTILIYPGRSDGSFANALPPATVPITQYVDGLNPVRLNDDCISDLAFNVAAGPLPRFFANNGANGFTEILQTIMPFQGLVIPLPSGDGVDLAFQHATGTGDQGFISRQLAKPSCPITPVAAVLPSSRSVSINQPVTLFATMVNPQQVAAKNCKVGFNSPVAATFSYQTTNPATNAPTGTPNTPVDIAAGGFQTFLLTFTASEAMTAREMRFGFICDNAKDATPPVRGVNTATLAVSATPVADAITVAATPTGDGIARIPSASGAGFFSVAAVNIGASATLTVAPNISGGAPLTATVCETNPATAACLAPPSANVSATFAPNVARTFSVFLTGNGTSFSPDFARKRVRLEFKEAGGQLRGATGVATCTVGAPGC